MRFEWNDSKRVSNLVKHGIDFVHTIEAFQSPMSVELDRRRDYGEMRYRGIGIVRGHIVTVVWTRREDSIRLISVRRANAKERARYQRENHSRGVRSAAEGL